MISYIHMYIDTMYNSYIYDSDRQAVGSRHHCWLDGLALWYDIHMIATRI